MIVMDGACLRLDHDIVTGSVAIRCCLSISGDTRVNELRVDLAECFIIHAIFPQSTREIILNQHITLSSEFMEDINARRGSEG